MTRLGQAVRVPRPLARLAVLAALGAGLEPPLPATCDDSTLVDAVRSSDLPPLP